MEGRRDEVGRGRRTKRMDNEREEERNRFCMLRESAHISARTRHVEQDCHTVRRLDDERERARRGCVRRQQRMPRRCALSPPGELPAGHRLASDRRRGLSSLSILFALFTCGYSPATAGHVLHARRLCASAYVHQEGSPAPSDEPISARLRGGRQGSRGPCDESTSNHVVRCFALCTRRPVPRCNLIVVV